MLRTGNEYMKVAEEETKGVVWRHMANNSATTVGMNEAGYKYMNAGDRDKMLTTSTRKYELCIFF